MSEWGIVVVLGLATVAMKGAGSLLGEGVTSRVALLQPVLAPAFLAALVASQVWSADLDVALPRVAALGVAALLMLLRAPAALVLAGAAACAIAWRAVASS